MQLMTTCPVRMAFGYLLLCLWLLLQIAHTQRVMAAYIETYNDYGHNHDEQRLHYSHQYHISDLQSQVHILHREQRRGDHVLGTYSHLEPGGYIRSVHYEVRGPHRGFKAVIQQRTAHSRVHQSLELRRKQPPRALALAQPVAFVV
ncbi:cuticle protein 7 [Drosophila madeirensis]|uniref:Cuticle protein 7 n=2 Tax=Drosophila madeirensis TaxID=30013 RepID=A0AAU9FSN3_DROMD